MNGKKNVRAVEEKKNKLYLKLRNNIIENNKVKQNIIKQNIIIKNIQITNIYLKKFDKKFKEKSSKIKQQTFTLDNLINYINEIKINFENKEKAYKNQIQIETLGNENCSTQYQEIDSYSSKENNLINNNKNLINVKNKDVKISNNDDNNNNYNKNNNQFYKEKDLTIINETINDNSKLIKSKELTHLISQIEIDENNILIGNIHNYPNNYNYNNNDIYSNFTGFTFSNVNNKELGIECTKENRYNNYNDSNNHINFNLKILDKIKDKNNINIKDLKKKMDKCKK